MAVLNLEIITPSKTVFSGEVNSITVPGTNGSFQVLKNHAPLISTFEIGSIKLEDTQGKFLLFATGGGTIEVNDNKILVLADSIELIEAIDIKRAQNAKERAEKRLANKSVEQINVVRAEASLARALNRIKLAEKYSAAK
jgi:F-type H+-transporting ATPase subunit epsilon